MNSSTQRLAYILDFKLLQEINARSANQVNRIVQERLTDKAPRVASA
jgi:hypothetical protein